MEHTLQERIAAIIEPSLTGMGYALVQVRMMESNHRRTLQIMAERLDEKNMTVEDCAAISHQVSALLDVEDPIKEAYALEISSPGIDRPLITRADFERHLGFDVKAESKMAIEGRKRFKGVITGVEGDEIVMTLTEGNVARIALHNLHSAKLLLTDKLIERHQKKHAVH
jgi:ribosome maturation factor RimP